MQDIVLPCKQQPLLPPVVPLSSAKWLSMLSPTGSAVWNESIQGLAPQHWDRKKCMLPSKQCPAIIHSLFLLLHSLCISLGICYSDTCQTCTAVTSLACSEHALYPFTLQLL